MRRHTNYLRPTQAITESAALGAGAKGRSFRMRKRRSYGGASWPRGASAASAAAGVAVSSAPAIVSASSSFSLRLQSEGE